MSSKNGLVKWEGDIKLEELGQMRLAGLGKKSNVSWDIKLEGLGQMRLAGLGKKGNVK